MWNHKVEYKCGIYLLNNPYYTNCKVGYSENKAGITGTKGRVAHGTDATILCLNGCFMPRGGMLGTNPIDITNIVRPKAVYEGEGA